MAGAGEQAPTEGQLTHGTLTMRPAGLSSGIDQDRADYTVFCGEWNIGRIYEVRGGPEHLRIGGLAGRAPPSGPRSGRRRSRRAAGAGRAVDAAGDRGIPEAPALGSRYAGVRAGFEARLVSCGALVDSVWIHGGWYMS